jgi:hypothetical protein
MMKIEFPVVSNFKHGDRERRRKRQGTRNL